MSVLDYHTRREEIDYTILPRVLTIVPSLTAEVKLLQSGRDIRNLTHESLLRRSTRGELPLE